MRQLDPMPGFQPGDEEMNGHPAHTDLH